MRKGDGSIDYFVSIIEDISARKQAEQELREDEERFRSSLLHSSVPVSLFDDREQILAISQSWLEQNGYLREQLPRLEDRTSRAYGEGSAELLERLRQIIIISTEPEARSAELKIRTKDGRERLSRFVSSALATQSDGRRLFVCVAQDVTDQKAHEEQVQLLMVGNDWQGVDVEDLVRAQLNYFADFVGSRITVHGSPVRLNAAAAQAIGLALHEFATNAGKYGALSADAGLVDVGWRLDGDIFAMSWSESKGPPVSPPERRGFGSTVVDPMVRQTVNGEVQLDFIPSGLVWRLTCPAANALERSAFYRNSQPSMRPASVPARDPVLRQPPAPTVH